MYFRLETTPTIYSENIFGLTYFSLWVEYHLIILEYASSKAVIACIQVDEEPLKTQH